MCPNLLIVVKVTLTNLKCETAKKFDLFFRQKQSHMIGEDIKYEVQHLLTEITEQTNETTDWIKSHGLNKVTYKNLDTFEGQYNEAKLRDGLGTYIWNMREKATTDDESAPLKQLAKFEGQYSGGVRNGFGKMTFPNQDVYQGTFKDGKV